MNPIFFRTAYLVVNTFGHFEGNNLNICFANFNTITGPVAGVYLLSGSPIHMLNTITGLGFLFCPSESRKLIQYFTSNLCSQFTIV